MNLAKKSEHHRRSLTRAPSHKRGTPVAQAGRGSAAKPQAGKRLAPQKQAARGQALLRWLTTSRLVIIVGVIVAAAILTVMYFRLVRPTVPAATATGASQATSAPTAPATPSVPGTGTPAALIYPGVGPAVA